jgi:pimeloyl-ACP methyl ester carboxylesterase
MSAISLSPTRRSLLAMSADAGALNLLPAHLAAAVDGNAIRPFRVNVAPRSWAEKAYPKLIYYNKLDKGGHFAAWEQPQLFSAELRAAFKSLRPSQNG